MAATCLPSRPFFRSEAEERSENYLSCSAPAAGHRLGRPGVRRSGPDFWDDELLDPATALIAVFSDDQHRIFDRLGGPAGLTVTSSLRRRAVRVGHAGRAGCRGTF